MQICSLPGLLLTEVPHIAMHVLHKETTGEKLHYPSICVLKPTSPTWYNLGHHRPTDFSYSPNVWISTQIFRAIKNSKLTENQPELQSSPADSDRTKYFCLVIIRHTFRLKVPRVKVRQTVVDIARQAVTFTHCELVDHLGHKFRCPANDECLQFWGNVRY